MIFVVGALGSAHVVAPSEKTKEYVCGPLVRLMLAANTDPSLVDRGLHEPSMHTSARVGARPFASQYVVENR